MTNDQNLGLKVRGRLVASHQIPVLSTDITVFRQQLQSTIKRAPALFKLAPVVLDLSSVSDISAEILHSIVNTCRTLEVIPYSLTSQIPDHKVLAEQLSLAWLDFKAQQNNRAQIQAPQTTKVITTPVRSGQQIYAKDANLVIMNLVSTGAEVIADGYIHIFGPLRGKAIAGATGYANADIICQKMSAEIVSIAGVYLVQEDASHQERGARCTLSENQIMIDYL